MSTNEKLGFCSNVLMIILEIVGLILCLLNGGFYNFIYYTVLSNTFGLITSVIYVIYYCRSMKEIKKNKEDVNLDNEVDTNKLQLKIPSCVRTLRFMSTVCLTVTFVVVFTILLPYFYSLGLSGELLYYGPQLYHHIICPLLSLISFILFENGLLTMKDVLFATLPTVIYGAVTLVLNIAKVMEGPYPFLKVYEQPVYASILYVIGIIGGTFCFSKLVQWITNKFSKKEEN
ncbi:hypothetical protein BCR32DRAFT_329830 [Anaeromyces robustus]|uniref:Uncharacterized protein n=1 Tax=Anaeromyces robustus TaxID=1754192 RepID=A0A1Y1WQJ1_9FUNG|nr:hypothetical protein BCR32DRAFT_329830 [Anaeromyces robustus]|eukprot:ORX75384.1 hypothetical protein BCR32DRAFT_329830 [Anaeromyces robustus]